MDSLDNDNLQFSNFRLEPFHPLVEEMCADDVDEMEVMVPIPEEGIIVSAPEGVLMPAAEEGIKNIIIT